MHRIVALIGIVCYFCTFATALTRLSHHANHVLDQHAVLAITQTQSLHSQLQAQHAANAKALTVASASTEGQIRPNWAKGPWPPVQPLFDKYHQRTEHEMQYQYRTCNNWAEWDEYYRQERDDVHMYYRYIQEEQAKISKLPLVQQSSNENQLKLKQMDDTYTKLMTELNALTEKATKTERIKACLPNVKAAIKDKISDSAKEELAIEAAIKQMKAKDQLAQSSCALVSKIDGYKAYASGAGVVCGLAIGNTIDSFLGTSHLFTGLCGAGGGFAGFHAVEKVKSIITTNMKIPEILLHTVETQLITTEMIEAQCKDRKAEAKAFLDANLIPYKP